MLAGLMAKYLCLRCNFEFERPVGPNYAECPICHHLYVFWINYKELYEKA